MAQSIRQRNLFAAEDFTVIWDSFKQANLKAYDYDTIRGAMIDYIKQKYPSNYNDYIKSSEFIAIIETLAFLAHSLAFRIDLAGRENFLSTAERRESILRIADFLGYTPARSLPARGLLKITSIRTSQNVYDINGNTLKNTDIPFNNDNNSYQNFLLVMNEILAETNKFGRPTDNIKIGNIKHDLYSTNVVTPRDAIYKFSGKVNNQTSQFEIHSVIIDDKTKSIEESIPDPFSGFDLLFRNDNQGISSSDTGFFVGFKQGTLQYTDVNAESAISNLIVDLATTNVNNIDTWVQNIDTRGQVQTNWTQVDSSFGASTTFNNIAQGNRTLYSVKTVDDDNVNVIFGDGVFSEIPRGIVRIWYRTGINQTYTLDPSDLGTVSFSFEYNAADGNLYTVSFEAELQASVDNASIRESATSIKQNAGRVFAAQDRMITAEDYSVYPLTVSENVKKIKAINRTHSGHSRYIKLNDPTAQYQSVDMLARDGYLFSEDKLFRSTASLPTTLSEEQIFEKFIDNTIINPEVINLFYSKNKPATVDFTSTAVAFEWQQITKGHRGSTGYFTRNGVIERAGETATTSLSDAKPGSIIEFVETPFNEGSIGSTGDTLVITNAGTGYTNIPTVTILGTGTGATATATISGGKVNQIIISNGGSGYENPVAVSITSTTGTGATASATAATAVKTWARVVSVVFEGQGITDSNGSATGLTNKGQGSIVLSKIIPNTARVSRIFPAYNTVFSVTEKNNIITQIAAKNTFGIRFDQNNGKWEIITSADLPGSSLDSPANFSLEFAGDNTSSNLDASWMIRANYSSNEWKIISRRIRYVFGSDNTIRFYNQNNRVKFNTETNKPERDTITISDINKLPGGSNYSISEDINMYAYKYYSEADGSTDDHKLIVTLADIDNDNYPDNPVAFSTIVSTDTINLGTVIEDGFSYIVRADTGTSVSGRQNLTFIWKRVSNSQYRIDPSLSNIIDIFVLTQSYDTKFKEWISNNRIESNMPLIPTEVEIKNQFTTIEHKKAVSDTIVYRPGQYRILFGELADITLQGKFKVVKVTGTTYTDNEIKKRILTAINEFFNLDNWDFGEVFYFTELSAYIHQSLQGIISSIVIIPTQQESVFGELFQITPNSNELFMPDVTLNDIELVNTLASYSLN